MQIIYEILKILNHPLPYQLKISRITQKSNHERVPFFSDQTQINTKKTSVACSSTRIGQQEEVIRYIHAFFLQKQRWWKDERTKRAERNEGRIQICKRIADRGLTSLEKEIIWSWAINVALHPWMCIRYTYVYVYILCVC